MLIFFLKYNKLSLGMSNIEQLIDNLREMVSNPHTGLEIEVHGLVTVLKWHRGHRFFYQIFLYYLGGHETWE